MSFMCFLGHFEGLHGSLSVVGDGILCCKWFECVSGEFWFTLCVCCEF